MNKIAEHIVATLKEYNPYYEYAEQQVLPYCVYEITSEAPVYTKHGIIGYTAEATVYLAAATEVKAQTLKEGVVSKLLVRQEGYTLKITSMQPAFAEEQWLWKIDISITQHFS